MKAYIYQAALLCEDCAIKSWARNALTHDPKDDHNSDKWAQGPYSDGGGEADSPNHCDMCNVFLENPLTVDGQNYVMNTARFDWSGEPRATWREFYSYLFVGDTDNAEV